MNYIYDEEPEGWIDKFEPIANKITFFVWGLVTISILILTIWVWIQ